MNLRKSLLALLAAAVLTPAALADEGMWLPMLISQRIEHMHEKGFTLDAEDIYSINQASLKDAVVLFGGGCTGEVVSPEGLLFTNHHCGYSQIQKHSSVEHDYLRDGFWALSRKQELPNPGLSVMFLEYMQDVTAEVSAAADRQAVIDSLVTSAEAAGKGLSAAVEEFYYGNQFFLFVYKEFSDCYVCKIVGDLSYIHLFAGGLVAVNAAPFPESGPLVVAIPEPPVENLFELFFERYRQFRRKSSFQNGICRPPICRNDLFYIFRTACPAFNFKDRNSGIDHLVHEFDSAEVFRGHDVFIVYLEFCARFQISHFVPSSAKLKT